MGLIGAVAGIESTAIGKLTIARIEPDSFQDFQHP